MMRGRARAHEFFPINVRAMMIRALQNNGVPLGIVGLSEYYGGLGKKIYV